MNTTEMIVTFQLRWCFTTRIWLCLTENIFSNNHHPPNILDAIQPTLKNKYMHSNNDLATVWQLFLSANHVYIYVYRIVEVMTNYIRLNHDADLWVAWWSSSIAKPLVISLYHIHPNKNQHVMPTTYSMDINTHIVCSAPPPRDCNSLSDCAAEPTCTMVMIIINSIIIIIIFRGFAIILLASAS